MGDSGFDCRLGGGKAMKVMTEAKVKTREYYEQLHIF